MESYLIVAKNGEKAEEYARSLCKEKEISDIDVTIIEESTTIGIQDVRALQQKIILAPVKSSAKACIIKDAQKLTAQAQNALLKILEEPPQRTILILAVESRDLLLATILSRCKIISLTEQIKTLPEKESSQFLTLLLSLFSDTIGKRLKLAQDIAKDKNEAAMWLEDIIIVARHTLLETAIKSDVNDKVMTRKIASAIQSFQQAHLILKTTNVNPRLTLEHFFLSL